MTIFDPRGFFRLGQRLATSDTPDEADLRTAIGRAYYSCFLVARHQLFGIDGRGLTNSVKKRLSQGRRNKSPGSHEAVLLALSTNKRVRLGVAKRLADQLGELKDMRIQADYFRDPTHRETTIIFSRYSVTGWLELAHQAMTLASNLLPDLERIPR